LCFQALGRSIDPSVAGPAPERQGGRAKPEEAISYQAPPNSTHSFRVRVRARVRETEPRLGGLGVGFLVLSPVPDAVCAGRLAEAEAESLKGAERSCSAPADQKVDGNAGAPEPKQTETGQG
jgi:hypothetical protein